MFAATALAEGWGHAVPTVPGLAYDALINFDEADSTTWWRVQVKRVFIWKAKGQPAINIRRGNEAGYKAGDADYLAAVDVDARTIHLFPWDYVYGQKRLVLTAQHDKFLLENWR